MDDRSREGPRDEQIDCGHCRSVSDIIDLVLTTQYREETEGFRAEKSFEISKLRYN